MKKIKHNMESIAMIIFFRQIQMDKLILRNSKDFGMHGENMTVF